MATYRNGSNHRLKVIIDTNGLMIPAQFNVDIFDELIRIGYDDFIVPKAVIEELEILNKKAKGTDRTAAKIAKSLSGRCRLVDITGNADDVIEELAFEMDADVLTNDIELKKKLISRGIRVVYLRQKNCLATT